MDWHGRHDAALGGIDTAANVLSRSRPDAVARVGPCASTIAGACTVVPSETAGTSGRLLWLDQAIRAARIIRFQCDSARSGRLSSGLCAQNTVSIDGHLSAAFATRRPGGNLMIELAIGALIIGVIASMLGFTTIAGASFTIAKVIGVIFLVLFVALLLAAWGVGEALL
jgi:uncharacterized membrane protein YtjA (UPF0391 family)